MALAIILHLTLRQDNLVLLLRMFKQFFGIFYVGVESKAWAGLFEAGLR